MTPWCPARVFFPTSYACFARSAQPSLLFVGAVIATIVIVLASAEIEVTKPHAKKLALNTPKLSKQGLITAIVTVFTGKKPKSNETKIP